MADRWITDKGARPSPNISVFVLEIVEDQAFPEQLLIPQVGWLGYDGVWYVKSEVPGGKAANVAGWMHVPPFSEAAELSHATSPYFLEQRDQDAYV